MKAPDTPVKLIVGLGNPGAEYAHTRHNAGQDLVESLAQDHGCTLTPESKFFGLAGKVNLAGRDIRLIVPTTFMNLSGKATAAICQFFKITPEEMLVVHDELDLEPGVAKLKIGGGHGGHNGLRDIIKCHGNNKNFARLRIGIGHPGNAKLVSNYVLKRAPQADQDSIAQAINTALGSLPDLAQGEWDIAMRELHTNK